MNNPKFIYKTVVIIISILFILYSIFHSYKYWVFMMTAIQTEGTIIGHYKGSIKRGTLYAPIFEFDHPNFSEKTRINSESFSVAEKYSIGDKIEIYYNENNDKEAFIVNDFPIKKWILFFCIGVVGLLIAIRTM